MGSCCAGDHERTDSNTEQKVLDEKYSIEQDVVITNLDRKACYIKVTAYTSTEKQYSSLKTGFTQVLSQSKESFAVQRSISFISLYAEKNNIICENWPTTDKNFIFTNGNLITISTNDFKQFSAAYKVTSAKKIRLKEKQAYVEKHEPIKLQENKRMISDQSETVDYGREKTKIKLINARGMGNVTGFLCVHGSRESDSRNSSSSYVCIHEREGHAEYFAVVKVNHGYQIELIADAGCKHAWKAGGWLAVNRDEKIDKRDNDSVYLFADMDRANAATFKICAIGNDGGVIFVVVGGNGNAFGNCVCVHRSHGRDKRDSESTYVHASKTHKAGIFVFC